MCEVFEDFESNEERLSGDPFYDPQDSTASEEYRVYTTAKSQDIAILCEMFPDVIRELSNNPERVGVKLIEHDIDKFKKERWYSESVIGELLEEYRLFVEISEWGHLDSKGFHSSKNSSLGLECSTPEGSRVARYSKLNLQIETEGDLARLTTIDKQDTIYLPMKILSYLPNNGVIETFLKAHAPSRFNNPYVDYSEPSKLRMLFFNDKEK